MKSNPNRRYYIYALREETSDTVMYVGVTCVSLQGRLSGHWSNAMRRRSGSPLACWLVKMNSERQKVVIEQICVCNQDTWEDAERYWINHYRSINSGLLNAKPGGKAANGITRKTAKGVKVIFLNEQLERLQQMSRESGQPVSKIVRDIVQKALSETSFTESPKI